VNIATYARRNLFRRKGRTILTIIAVAVAILIFCTIRATVTSFNAGADEAAQDRIATRHKISITMQLPLKYIEEVRSVPGIKASTWANWFGGKDPNERVPFFAAFAADQNSFFDVMDEMIVEPAVLEEWKRTPNGAILGDVLAKNLEVTVGGEVTLISDIYPGNWKFKVVGLYTPKRKTADRNSLVFRWDFLNNELERNPQAGFPANTIGWVMSRIAEPGKSAEVSRAIDAKFDERDDQTLTMSEKAFQAAFVAGFAAVLDAFAIVSLIILLVMLLILANTIAMSVRERTHEYGVLRAIGFSPGYVVFFILFESVLVATVGGLLGLLLVLGLVNNGIGPALEASGFFPYFEATSQTMLIALGLAAGLGLIAGLVPAIQTSRRKVTDSLRRID
jgi:putative ABC transport system permease protein